MTTSQFFQGLCKLNLGINASDASLLAEKFGHEELPDLVNYALFSRVANPTTSPSPNGESSSCTKEGTCGRRSQKSFTKIYLAIYTRGQWSPQQRVVFCQQLVCGLQAVQHRGHQLQV